HRRTRTCPAHRSAGPGGIRQHRKRRVPQTAGLAPAKPTRLARIEDVQASTFTSVLTATPPRRRSRVLWVSSASSGPGDCRGSRERKNNGDRPAAHVKGAGKCPAEVSRQG